ncbi:MAG: MBL fold metallo-hydrolase [Candidatus Parvarchaeota archaeon]|nr:MBL fold metallo-hydrolase [Candidatus Jingweiarchaeum tengchongense]MCW1300459.1 MBL fold metallo-hydrolase [Candidatus Jingweiarchaeum tengchongense]MCW1304951.1 MBL fold metallo-hydrolase [Candidatus Jingweiarchaeum tengchongense]MCW1305489.1 MBL fold metallo-hydrolase [Candidatus Jingweiarchaeum tengchongense]MCW1309440.1 MBL fold metallo-hydrolase [Candidatus Jingweiarchaeum tengchongense]
MTSLTFYGGVNEIGGNKILLEDKETKIFLDFGMNFSMSKKYYGEFLQPRTLNGLGDLLEFGIIPDIDGIYRDDLLKKEGRRITGKPRIDGVLISHAHADHCWHVSLLHKDVPIYCGETTKFILQAVQETSQGVYYTDFFMYRECFVNRREKPKFERKFNTFRTGDKIKIDSLEILPIHIDHSIPGAYGFIIHTSKGAIVYTGDFRMHGPMKEFTYEFIEAAKKEKPIAMICEGTRVKSRRIGPSEDEVKRKIDGIVKETKKLVIVNFSPRDIDRLNSFFDVSKRNGREFVISLKMAYLLKLLSSDKRLKVPRLDEVSIYAPRSGWGLITEDYPISEIEKDYDKWAREFLKHEKLVNCNDIRKKQEKFVFYCNYFDLNELIDIRPMIGSTYIYSLSEPFDEEQEIDYNRMKNWLAHFKLPMRRAHASGHACGKEIEKMVNEINPKILFPVHTDHVDIFKKIAKNAVQIEKGREYKI